MVSIDLSEEEFNIIKVLRKMTMKNDNRKLHLSKFSNGVKKQIERQNRNMRQIYQRMNKSLNKYHSSNNQTIKKSYKKVEKTKIIDGKLYKIILEDIGDGNGLIETHRILLGNMNNVKLNSRMSLNMNSKEHKSSYRRVEKTETKDGKIYKIILEDNGDGKGLVETDRELLGDVRNMGKIFNKLRKNSRNRNNSRNRSRKNKKGISYKRKESIKKINGKGYRIIYENRNNGKGYVEVKREEI